MNALSLSALRRRDQVVILTGPAPGAKSANRIAAIGKSVIRAAFSAKASMAVAVALAFAIWGAIIVIDDTIAQQAAVARACLLALPWGIVSAARAIRKGGEL